MRKILSVLSILFLLTSNSWATVGWRISIPATSENPQAISPDVIENNTALDLMLQNYRDGGVYVKLISTSEIDIGPGGVMLSNAGGSTRLMVANASLTAVSSTMIDTGTISSSSTYYLYAYASSTTATTFSVIFSASSTSPTGITYYAKLGSFTTNASSNFSSASSSVNYQVGLGTWSSQSGGTGYQAATDGFIVGYIDNIGGTPILSIYINTNPSPSSGLMIGHISGSGVASSNFCFPVNKGYYYELVVGGGTLEQFYFVPLGT